ncbi:hypothetical protein EW146_g2120 [Bondarzewia mesenterica]|uniref:NAD-dependent epimerase/dehydratase domain-containing protein n=1 Tax=Bondarzewia mesenterica TaxID=1095465 RepID=A0A4S4M1N9_9AGAM|nr:hypothetical protein EW146_g2120 [Bondarzewia mesenterica]
MSLVLVTGASGFVGSHVVDQLLKAGYRVRGMARGRKAEHLHKAYASSTFANSFNVATAVAGTRRVLECASAAEVQKIVLTGSVINLLDTRERWKNRTYTEDDWSPLTYEHAIQPGTDSREVYAVAKKLAEEEFWAFAQEHPDIDATSSMLIQFESSHSYGAVLTKRIRLVLPPWLYGPYGRCQPVYSLRSGTNQLVYDLISGPRGRPMQEQRVNPGFAHVADAARAHVLALSAPPDTLKRKRVIVMSGYGLWREAVVLLRASRPELSTRLPMLTGAEADPEAYARFDGSSAEKVLGMRVFKGWKETIEETVDDLLRMEKLLGSQFSESSPGALS